MKREDLFALRLSPHGAEFDTPQHKEALWEALTLLPSCTDAAEAERLYWQIDNFIVVQGTRGPDAHLLFGPLLDAVAEAGSVGRVKLLEAAHQLFFSGREARYPPDGESHEREHLQRVLFEHRPLLKRLHQSDDLEEQYLTSELLSNLP